MMKKVLHKNEDLLLKINIDPEFNGIFFGIAHDESEGCSLKGKLVMEVKRKTRIKALYTILTGSCRVSFKTVNGIGVPTSDGTEAHSIFRKTIKHFDETMIRRDQDCVVKSTVFEPGTYTFPFDIYIPPSIPHTFEGKYGLIDYELEATALRGSFSVNAHTSKRIILRRCLMNDWSPIETPFETVQGTKLGEILSYSATTPSMVYSEGGLLTLDLEVTLKDPMKYSIRMVTCGLQEKVFYRTTGRSSVTSHAMNFNDFSYPLGCSTFFPSEHPDYDTSETQRYNAIFRLYPRVHTDNRSSLIVVQHALVIRLVIDDCDVVSKRKDRRNSTDSTRSFGISPKSFFSYLSMKQNDVSTCSISSMHHYNEQHENVDFASSTSLCRSPTLSERSSTGDLLSTSPTPLDQMNPFQSNVVRVSSNKPIVNEMESSETEDTMEIHHHFNPLEYRKEQLEDGSYECLLSVPVIVTSREEYRENSVPALPDYETSVYEPPSYRASLDSLPPVPIYSSDNNTSSLIN